MRLKYTPAFHISAHYFGKRAPVDKETSELLHISSPALFNRRIWKFSTVPITHFLFLWVLLHLFSEGAVFWHSQGWPDTPKNDLKKRNECVRDIISSSSRKKCLHFRGEWLYLAQSNDIGQAWLREWAVSEAHSNAPLPLCRFPSPLK